MDNKELRVFLISTLKNDSGIVGYRLLDIDANGGKGDTKDIPVAAIVNALRTNKIKINGIKYRKSDNQLIGTNGALTRYAIVTDKGLIEKSPLVILEQLMNEDETIGYKVSDYKGTILTLRPDDVITYSKSNGIANGKIVTIDGKEFISSISGNYSKIQIKPKIKKDTNVEKTKKQGLKDWITLEEFMEYMNSKEYSYKLNGDMNKLTLSSIDPNVEVLHIPIGITSIERLGGYGAEHRLKTIYIPNTVVDYSYHALSSLNNLENIIYQDGTESIDLLSINNKLENINIPKSVKEIRGFKVIDNNINLTDTSIESINDSFNGSSSNKIDVQSIKLPNTLRSISDSFEGLVCKTPLEFGENLEIIRGSFNYSDVQSINFDRALKIKEFAHNSFNNNSQIIELDLEKTNITDINYKSFSNCSNLTSVKLPDTLRNIGGNTFSGCRALSNLDIKKGIQTIENGAFSYSSIAYFKVYNTIEKLGEGTFSEKTTLEYEEGTEVITAYTLGTRNCDKIILPNSVIDIKPRAFDDVSVNSLEFGTGLQVIGGGAFRFLRKLEDLDLRICVNLREVCDEAFKGSEVKKIVLPEGLVSLGATAIQSCNNLQSMYIPKTVESFGRAALSGSGKEAGLGTTFYIHPDSPAHNYCKRNKLRFILVDSLQEFDSYFQIEERELDERKLAKFRMVLSLSEGEIANKLLEDKYINYADILISLSDAMKNELGQYINVELNIDNLISVPLSKIPGMVEIDKEVDKLGINSYSNNISVFNNLVNIITKSSSIEPKVMTTNALKYYEDNNIVKRISIIYNDGTNKIYNLTLDGFGTSVANEGKRKYNIIIVTSDDVIRYITLNTVSVHLGKAESELLKLNKSIKENDGTLTEPIIEYIEINSTLDKYDDNTLINNAPVPKRLSNQIFKKSMEQWIVAKENIIKHNMYDKDEGAAEVTFICAITGKIIDTEVRYTWWEHPEKVDKDRISVIQINNIRDSLDELTKAEVKETGNSLMDTTGADEFILKINSGDDYIKDLMKLPDAYDSNVSYEFELSKALEQLNITKVNEINEPAFTAIVNTAYFTKITRTYESIMKSNRVELVECDDGMHSILMFRANRVRGNNEIIDGNDIENCVVLLEKRQYNKSERLDCYASGNNISRILSELKRMNKVDNLKHINNTWKINDEQIYKNNLVPLVELDPNYSATVTTYSFIGLDKVYGTISLVGYFYDYENKLNADNLAIRLLNFKDIKSALQYKQLITDSLEIEDFHNELLNHMVNKIFHNEGRKTPRMTNEEALKIRKYIMKGYPNGYHIGGNMQQLYDLCLKQRP